MIEFCFLMRNVKQVKLYVRFTIACSSIFKSIFVLLAQKKNISHRFQLQGALDGGLDIPHSDKRFAGFKKDEKQLNSEVHRNYIFGGHVAAYMRVSLIIPKIVSQGGGLTDFMRTR